MNEDKQEVIIKDIKMPLISMIVFMVKWSIAAIPALLILFVFGALFWAVLARMIIGDSSIFSPTNSTSTEQLDAPKKADIPEHESSLPVRKFALTIPVNEDTECQAGYGLAFNGFSKTWECVEYCETGYSSSIDKQGKWQCVRLK